MFFFFTFQYLKQKFERWAFLAFLVIAAILASKDKKGRLHKIVHFQLIKLFFLGK